MSKGVLVDLTKCIGCGSCTVACKLWNDLDFDDKKPATGEKVKLCDKNWTVVTSNEVTDKNDKPVWRFVKEQCFHCKEPACVSACFSKALQKNADGAVVYYPELCVGCRYCMVACPFDVPKYEWEKALPLVTKCNMCSTRIAKGEPTACSAVCPTGALEFGERDDLLAKAKALIAKDDKYIKTVYGEKEVGGTDWLYISDIPFGQLDFKTNLGTTALPTYSNNFLKYIPGGAVVWGAMLTGMYYYTKRREAVTKEKAANEDNKTQNEQDKTKNIGEENDDN